MATETELRDWRDRLFKARLGGVRAVQDQNGQRVEYANDREMASAIAAADRAIAQIAGRAPPKTILFQTSKGL
jgi:hypothetical protein